MKVYFRVLMLILVSAKGWTQNTNLDYRGAIKISNQTSYERFNKLTLDTDTTLNFISTSALHILHPTIAYQWKTKKQNFHEIEITNFSFNKTRMMTEIVDDSIVVVGPGGYYGVPIAGGNSINVLISMKYEYIMTFRKLKEKKLIPSFGFSANPYFKRTNFSPVLSNAYPTSEQFFGARFFVTPRLTYYVGSKFFIDLNIPLCVLSTYFLTDRLDNPVQPVNERRTNTFSFETFPSILNARIGIGIKI